MKTMLTLFSVFASVILASGFQAARAQPVVSQDGPYSIIMQDLGGNKFALTVNLRKPTYSEVITYMGACKSSIQVDLVMPEPKAMKAFEASGNYNDLNAGPIVEIFIRELSKKCPDTNIVEAVLLRMDRPVVASFSKASGWKNTLEKLTAEAAANPVDKIIEEATKARGPMVPFAANDPFAGVQTRGYVECKAESTIGISGPNTFPSRARRFTEYRSFARLAAPEFKKLCPEVEQIKFRPASNPAGFECEGDCYLEARFSSDNWSVAPVGYDRTSGRETIQNFDDMLALMKAGDFSDIRNNYTGYYKQFHNQFLSAYSGKCGAHIENPVSFEFVTVENTIDSNGLTIGSRQVGQPYTITMDRKYEDAFFKYSNAVTVRLLDRILEAEVKARAGGPSSAGFETVFGEVVSDGERLNRFVNQRCTHPEVMSVYNRLGTVLP